MFWKRSFVLSSFVNESTAMNTPKATKPADSAASDVVMGENMQPAGPNNPARLIQHADGSVTPIAGSSSIHDTRYTGAQDITYDPQTGLPIVTQLTPGQMQPPRVEDYMTWTEQSDGTWAPASGADGNPLIDWPSYTEALAHSQLTGSQAGAQNSDIGKNYDDMVTQDTIDTPIKLAEEGRNAQTAQFAGANTMGDYLRDTDTLALGEGKNVADTQQALLPYRGSPTFGDKFAAMLNPISRAVGGPTWTGSDIGYQEPDIEGMRTAAENRVAGPGGVTMPTFGSILSQVPQIRYTAAPDVLANLGQNSNRAQVALNSMYASLNGTGAPTSSAPPAPTPTPTPAPATPTPAPATPSNPYNVQYPATVGGAV